MRRVNSRRARQLMDNTLYVGLSRQMTLRREFDLLANNIANAETVGFKTESLMLDDEPTRPKPPRGPAQGPIHFVMDQGVARDFSQGSLKQTGNPLDLAVSGDGFFQVADTAGARFTRDGRFTIDSEGKLTTQAGAPVMSDSGGEIILDPSKGPPRIAEDGTVSQGGAIIGRVGVYRFADLAALSKEGDNLYSNKSNLQPEQANDAKVVQGATEGSNVQTILQMTRLIEVSRAYESTAKMIDNIGSLSSQSVQRLGRAQ